MFWVFAINETAEREKHSKRISPQLSALVRLGKLDADKAAEQLAAAVDDHMKCVRAKPLADFEMPSSAEEYADVLRKTPGFRDIAIKARVLAPPQQGRCQAWTEMGCAPRAGRHRPGRAIQTPRHSRRRGLCATLSPVPRSTTETLRHSNG